MRDGKYQHEEMEVKATFSPPTTRKFSSPIAAHTLFGNNLLSSVATIRFGTFVYSWKVVFTKYYDTRPLNSGWTLWGMVYEG